MTSVRVTCTNTQSLRIQFICTICTLCNYSWHVYSLLLELNNLLATVMLNTKFIYGYKFNPVETACIVYFSISFRLTSAPFLACLQPYSFVLIHVELHVMIHHLPLYQSYLQSQLVNYTYMFSKIRHASWSSFFSFYTLIICHCFHQQFWNNQVSMVTCCFKCSNCNLDLNRLQLNYIKMSTIACMC